MKITLKPVRVLVGLNAGNMCATEMFAHEVPIQQLVRGEDKVQYIEDLDPKLYNMGPYKVDSRDELVRLKRKYQPMRDGDGANPVDAIFPDGSRDLEAFYSNGGEVKTVQTRDPAPPAEQEDVAEKPKKAARREIIAELMELNVDFAMTQPTQQLAAKLAEVKAGIEAAKEE